MNGSPGNPQAEALAVSRETIGAHEAYYIPASLYKDPLFCGDDRNELGIQLFGGVINVPYNQAIVEEAIQPGSVRGSLEGRVGTATRLLIGKGFLPGVHSDTMAEQGSQFQHTLDGAVGCAYAELRPKVSLVIADLGESLVDDAIELYPELFPNKEDREFAIDVTRSHRRLANRSDFQVPGRKLVQKAASEGAQTAVLEGGHVASDGILNTVRNTTFNSKGAVQDGLPAYNHDSWAATEIAEELGVSDPADIKRLEIANLIDALGTMHALGVETIAVRR